MSLERNSQSQSAKSVFFEEFNDIDVYIEDTAHGYEKVFSIILSRILCDQFKIEKVFPLGGRREVIEHHRIEYKESNRQSLYIVDGDLFILSKESLDNKPGLYVLPFYCIENVLIDEKALLVLLDEEESIKDLSEMAEEFNYSEWLDVNEPLLYELFVEYAISFKINPSEQTTAYEVKKLVSDNKGNLNSEKVKARIFELKEKTIASSDYETYIEARNEMLDIFEQSSLSKLDVVSAKDYIFPLLWTRFKSIVTTRISNINFRQRLARHCDLSKIEDIGNQIVC
ncbi:MULTISPECIES: DUF4435 domain-containing protein [unclassified Endozoicomonas]|uniref:DUF4435 domain-containing protein n=1 Tax=unclassified Endozoicomonas TaxID=2644528 RepID=UPI003BB5F4FA